MRGPLYFNNNFTNINLALLQNSYILLSMNPTANKISWERFTSTCIRSGDSRFWIIKGAFKFTFMDDKDTSNNREFESEKEAMDWAENIVLS